MMRGRPTAQAELEYYARLSLVGTRTYYSGTRHCSRASSRTGWSEGCPPFESSGAKIHVQPIVTALLYRFKGKIPRYIIALHAFAVIVPFISITGN